MASHSRHGGVPNPNLAGIGVWAEDEIQHRLRAELRPPGLSKVTRDQPGTKPHPGSNPRPRIRDHREGGSEEQIATVSPIPKPSTRGAATSGHGDRGPRSERRSSRGRADTEEKYEPHHNDRPRHPDQQREWKPRTSGRPRHRPTPEEEARLVRRVRTIRSLNLFGCGSTDSSRSSRSNSSPYSVD